MAVCQRNGTAECLPLKREKARGTRKETGILEIADMVEYRGRPPRSPPRSNYGPCDTPGGYLVSQPAPPTRAPSEGIGRSIQSRISGAAIGMQSPQVDGAGHRSSHFDSVR
jgi:hypothetical protein